MPRPGFSPRQVPADRAPSWGMLLPICAAEGTERSSPSPQSHPCRQGRRVASQLHQL